MTDSELDLREIIEAYKSCHIKILINCLGCACYHIPLTHFQAVLQRLYKKNVWRVWFTQPRVEQMSVLALKDIRHWFKPQARKL